MAAFIAQQPNGLYCRFSVVVDCPTHYNMTKEDYLDGATMIRQSREEAEDILNNHLYPFSEVEERFKPYNMSKREFARVLKSMNTAPVPGQQYSST